MWLKYRRTDDGSKLWNWSCLFLEGDRSYKEQARINIEWIAAGTWSYEGELDANDFEWTIEEYAPREEIERELDYWKFEYKKSGHLIRSLSAQLRELEKCEQRLEELKRELEGRNENTNS